MPFRLLLLMLFFVVRWQFDVKFIFLLQRDNRTDCERLVFVLSIKEKKSAMPRQYVKLWWMAVIVAGIQGTTRLECPGNRDFRDDVV